MSFRITCYTLFNVTQTGVVNRPKPSVEQDVESWIIRRNTQCNLDTILQAVSLRSQPELISSPEKIEIRFDTFDKFGFLFEQMENETYPCWKFDFDIQHPSVFHDGRTELGALYNDCDGVPMLRVGTEWNKLPDFLDTSSELRNIYFEVTEND